MGGNIPNWIKTTFAPKAIVDGWGIMVDYSKKNPV